MEYIVSTSHLMVVNFMLQYVQTCNAAWNLETNKAVLAGWPYIL
jgi:hypothetical protein